MTNLIKTGLGIVLVLSIALIMEQCKNKDGSEDSEYKILFLHHSTGDVIYRGGSNARIIRGVRIGKEFDVPAWFKKYNKAQGTSYTITEQNFPKGELYQWKNYPFDYYNIWVKHAGNNPYMGEPTLEMLTREYDLIVFKHCYPVCDINADMANADIGSEEKTLANYKLQYEALKKKLKEFPDTKFILWTGAARVKSQMDTATATRAGEFFNWVRNQWDTPGDNIFLWDFYELETEGGLFLKDKYATGANDSHPVREFGARAAPLFCQRIVDVIENNGENTTLTGKLLNRAGKE